MRLVVKIKGVRKKKAKYEIKTKSVWNFLTFGVSAEVAVIFFYPFLGVLLRVHTESESIIREAF
jgi:hypothetical protein